MQLGAVPWKTGKGKGGKGTGPKEKQRVDSKGKDSNGLSYVRKV